MSAHEVIAHTPVKVGSNRNFGLVFAVVFFLFGMWPFFKGDSARLWALIVAGLFMLTALVAPSVLRWPNKIWARLGILLGRIVTPIVMGILFCLVIVPIGLILRRRFKQMIDINANAKSYWVDRSGPVIESESYEKQF